jgi:hypothetical protein
MPPTTEYPMASDHAPIAYPDSFAHKAKTVSCAEFVSCLGENALNVLDLKKRQEVTLRRSRKKNEAFH